MRNSSSHYACNITFSLSGEAKQERCHISSSIRGAVLYNSWGRFALLTVLATNRVSTRRCSGTVAFPFGSSTTKTAHNRHNNREDRNAPTKVYCLGINWNCFHLVMSKSQSVVTLIFPFNVHIKGESSMCTSNFLSESTRGS